MEGRATSSAKNAVRINQPCDDRSQEGTGLFHKYFDRLFSLVFYSVGKDYFAAERIARDTFLTALKSVSKFSGKTGTYAWLISIANKQIADYYRSLNIGAKSSRNAAYTFAGNSTQPLNEEFESILFRLPLHYRQVLLLKYVEEMPVREISWIMGRSPKSIEGLLTRARIILKNK